MTFVEMSNYLIYLVVYVIHRKQLEHTSRVTVEHRQVRHVFDRNEIVIMKLTRSKKRKTRLVIQRKHRVLAHNDGINIIHIKHPLVLMRMLTINFMTKIIGKWREYDRVFFPMIAIHNLEHQINHQHRVIDLINWILEMTTGQEHQSQGNDDVLFFFHEWLFVLVLKKNNKNFKNLCRKIGVTRWIMKRQRKKNYTGRYSSAACDLL